MSGESYRKGGPIGAAPHSGTGTMSQTKAVTANTTAREAPIHQAQSPVYTKDIKGTPNFGELGARGHGGAG